MVWQVSQESRQILTEGCGWHVGRSAEVRVEQEQREARRAGETSGDPNSKGQSDKHLGHLKICLGFEKIREPQQSQQQSNLNCE